MIGKPSNMSKSSFKRHYSSSADDSDQLLGHYLAGLIEGDGSIVVPKTIRNQKGKLLYPVVKITSPLRGTVEKDAPLAKKIQEVLNGGTLVYPKDTNYLNLLFRRRDLSSKVVTTFPIPYPLASPGIRTLLYSKSKLMNLTEVQFSSSALVASVSYANADTQKESILNDNKSKAGVYC